MRQTSLAAQQRAAENSKDSSGDDQTGEPCATEDAAVLWRFRTARKQNREYDQNGDGADVDENLREAGELRIEVEKEQCKSTKSDRQREGAVHKIAQRYCRQGAADGDCGQEPEHKVHHRPRLSAVTRDLLRIAIAPRPEVFSAHACT